MRSLQPESNVSSIGDNQLGRWTACRMSKAALNMLVRTMVIEQARTAPHSVIVALYPRTLDTPLSRPFAKRVPDSSPMMVPELTIDGQERECAMQPMIEPANPAQRFGCCR